ncbi:MAG: hypothetical protein U0270_46385 [Labilithrix sp.]
MTPAPTATATSAATTTTTAPLAPEAPPDPASARPKPLEDPAPRPLPWDRMIDVGGDFLIAARPAMNDVKGNPSEVRYQPATGFGLHLRFALLEHLLIEGYYVDVHHTITIPSGALGVTDPIASPPVETYSFGARLSPSMTWGRVTAWLTAGVGWGRFEFQRATATNSKGETYVIRERGASFVELPVGAGARIELVKRWLSLDLTTTYAFIAGQHGDAFEPSQTIAPDGHPRALDAFPVIESSFVQSIGLSLLL